MKSLAAGLALLFVLTSNITLAKSIRVVTGSGQESGSCDYRTGPSCISGIKFLAERKAEQNAQYTCERTYRGKALVHSRICSSNCSPSYIPPYTPPAFVTCRSRCNMNCEID